MTDPLSLVPLSLAARGGLIDAHPVATLVAAGVTLLQRSAPLVRALSMGRSAIVLPPSAAVLVALAASDGRGAVLLDPASTAARLREQLSESNVRAVFTVRALMEPVGRDRPIVLLDRAPWQATVLTGDDEFTVDLGSHFGLSLVGEQDVPGRDEECVVFYDADTTARAKSISHRDLLAALRHAAGQLSDRAAASVSTSFTSITSITSIASQAELVALLAPLLNGHTVRNSGS
jgi:acyl-CoA synthetase (AMP-forming)/AMP-acid ligase II